MPKKGHSEEQISRAFATGGEWRRGERDLPRVWYQRGDLLHLQKKYSGMGLSELRELRQLREENGKLKRLVADLSFDRHILQEIVQKKL